MLKIIKESTPVHTHRLEFDVLMKDLTTRKIEINFNGWDEWDEVVNSPIEAAGMLYRCVTNGLNNDNSTLGWKATLLNTAVGKKVTEYMPYAKTRLQ